MAHPEGLRLTSDRGEPRGYVDPKIESARPALEDLWIMQGSLCDLRCTHCYTASSPTNGRLEQIAFAELRPHLDDAARCGAGKIYFTGGEVFVNEDVLRGRARRNEEFLKSLEYALEIAPVDILTNGRRYILNHLDALDLLRARHGRRLTLRITLESPRPEAHDAIRGRGTWAQTMETVRVLARSGFRIVIAAERAFLEDSFLEDTREIHQQYQALFPETAIEVSLIGNLLEMGHQLVQLSRESRAPRPEVFVTTSCFGALGRPPESLMCHSSRCIQKIAGALRYYPCPVIYDDPRFDLGGSLEESWRRVYTAHPNCYGYCLRGQGASCRTQAV
jgi:MoaA/NifB/PqqE/SkfB family radical SAM enzyme